MQKSDESIKNIVTASIKRHSMEIESWESTRLWDNFSEEIRSTIGKHLDVVHGELGLIGYYINQDNWYLITTRGVIIADGGQIQKVEIERINRYYVGDFKGVLTKRKVDIMQLKREDQVIAEFWYETGKPSMGAIYGISTLLSICRD
jgi:hypothetical protein